MRLRSGEYEVVLTREGRKWTAEVPALPGCITWGGSRDEALTMAQEAIEGWLRSRRAIGKGIPAHDIEVEVARLRVSD